MSTVTVARVDGAEGLLSRRAEDGLGGAQALGLPCPVVVGDGDLPALGHDVQAPAQLLQRRARRGDLGEQSGGRHGGLLRRVQGPLAFQGGGESFGRFGSRDRQSDGLPRIVGSGPGDQAQSVAHVIDQASVVRLLVAPPQRFLLRCRLRHRRHPPLLSSATAVPVPFLNESGRTG
jgi:hypothetical protein